MKLERKIQMKKSIKLTLTIFVFFLALTGIRFLWMMNVSPKVNFGESEAGVMDLSSFESGKALYPLAGEWLYYPDVLLSADEIKKNPDKGHVKHYPQDWLEQSAIKDYNYGTFYTRLYIHDNLLHKSLSFHVPNARLATKLFVDGELLGASGNPSSNLADFEASMSPYVVHFFADKNMVDIVLHVSNSGTKPPVPLTPIVFGTTDSIQENQVFSTISKLVVVTVFSFMFLFAVFLFLHLKMSQRKTMFYLAIYFIFNILTVMLDYDRVILLDLPLAYEIKSKILRISYVLNALFAFQFFKHFLSGYKTSTLYNYYPYVNLLYILFLIIAPIELIDKYGASLVVIFIIPIVYFVVKLFNAVRHEAEDAELLLLVGLSMLNNLLWSIYKNFADVLTFEYYPIDVLIALVLFILYWIRKYIRYTEENKALTAELIAKDKDKDDFLAQTSHELRNPLHSIMNIAQLVVDNPKNSIIKEDKESMNLLLSVGKRMSLLIDDLLDLTLMNEKKLNLVKSPVYMRTVVAMAIDMLDYLVITKNITIQNKIEDDLPPVYADENRVIQLTLNLIHNAIKFTDEGMIVITGHVADGDAVIMIHDTGRGMSSEYVNNIFEPFFKSNDVDGIGLGLQVTKELIDLHGGDITISSALHKGTTVSFTLPIAEEPLHKNEMDASTGLLGAESEQLVAATLENSKQGKDAQKTNENNKEHFRAKILLVDDDQVNVEVMAKVLHTDHYEVVTVLSGKEALQKIQTSSFDLVISDVMMPHMSGYELVKKIREQYGISELPIILLTARGKMDDLNTGFQVGANDYVVKPVDALELKARVNALTDLQTAIKAQLKLEAAWLQAQISPHFLYNTINSIMMMAKANPVKMKYLLEKFVYFLRTSYAFQSKQSLVSLQDELKLIDAYLTIEKERFGERLQIIWGIDESLDIFIPPLSIQTLVENALKHGILNQIEGGTITLQSIEAEDHVDLIVQDDGEGMSKQLIQKVQRHELIKGDGIGLINTDKRVRKWLQNPLIIESEVGKGTKIIIRVKKVK